MTAPSTRTGPPGCAGQHRRDPDDLDTPALLVDLDVFAENAGRIAVVCRAHGVRWRPHVKAVKAPALAARLMAAGASGLTCATLGEAETMAAAGLGPLLIANQVVGAAKVERLVALLRRRADVTVAVDSMAGVGGLAAAATAAASSCRWSSRSTWGCAGPCGARPAGRRAGRRDRPDPLGCAWPA